MLLTIAMIFTFIPFSMATAVAADDSAFQTVDVDLDGATTVDPQANGNKYIKVYGARNNRDGITFNISDVGQTLSTEKSYGLFFNIRTSITGAGDRAWRVASGDISVGGKATSANATGTISNTSRAWANHKIAFTPVAAGNNVAFNIKFGIFSPNQITPFEIDNIEIYELDTSGAKSGVAIYSQTFEGNDWATGEVYSGNETLTVGNVTLSTMRVFTTDHSLKNESQLKALKWHAYNDPEYNADDATWKAALDLAKQQVEADTTKSDVSFEVVEDRAFNTATSDSDFVLNYEADGVVLPAGEYKLTAVVRNGWFENSSADISSGYFTGEWVSYYPMNTDHMNTAASAGADSAWNKKAYGIETKYWFYAGNHYGKVFENNNNFDLTPVIVTENATYEATTVNLDHNWTEYEFEFEIPAATTLTDIKFEADHASSLAVNAVLDYKSITLEQVEAKAEPLAVELFVDAPETANAGNTFTVDVLATTSQYTTNTLNALNFVVDYNDDVLQLVSIKPAAGVDGTAVDHFAAYGWNGGAEDGVAVEAGTKAAVATITFKVLDAAKAGDTEITLGSNATTKLNAKILGVAQTFVPVVTKDTVEVINNADVAITVDPVGGGTVSADSAAAPVGSKITVDADGVLYVGDEEITAIEGDLYDFDGWYIGSNKIDADGVEVTTNADIDITAKFVIGKADVSFTVEGTNGSITNGDSVKLDAGTKLTVTGNTIAYGETTVTATPAENYYFVAWILDENAVTDEVTLEKNGNYEFIATFAHETETVTFVTSGNGEVAPASKTVNVGETITADNNTLKIGEDVIATATASQYNKFVGWKLNDADFTGSQLIAKGGNYTFTAVFEPVTVEITVNAGSNGKVDPEEFTVNEGKTITADNNFLKVDGETVATATADANYAFAGWKLNGSAFTTVTVEDGETYAFTAEFADIPVDISFSAIANGGVAPTAATVKAGDKIVADNEKLVIGGETIATATPDTNYKFVGWYLNESEEKFSEVTVAADTAYSFKAKFEIITHEATFAAVANGTVSMDKATVNAGDTIAVAADGTLTIGTVSVTVTPASADYKFKGWLLNDAAIPADAKIAADGTYAFTAEFETVDVTINVAAENGTVDKATVNVKATDKITVDGETLKVSGVVVATAQPATNYKFAKWTLNDADINGEITVAAGNTYNFKAVYEIITVNATFAADANGAVDVNEATANAGAEITSIGNKLTFGTTTVTATPKTADYQFKGWKLNGVEFTGGIVAADGTYVFTAEFETVGVTINVAAENGTVDEATVNVKATDKITVDGETLKVNGNVVATAQPATNYKFVKWTLNDADINGEITVAAGNTYSFKAVYEIITVNATFAADANGSVDVNEATANAGTEITVVDNKLTFGTTTVTATANTNYKFKGWKLNGAAFTGGTVAADGTYEFTAEFEIITKELKFEAAANGGVDVTKVTVDAGTEITVADNKITAGGTTVIATANANYKFAGWEMNGNPTANGTIEIAADTEYTFTAKFVLESSNVTISAVNGSVNQAEVAANVTDTVTVSNNTITIGTTTVTASPTNGNYEFKGWFLDNAEYNGGTIEADKTYAFVAKYELIKKDVTFAAENGTLTNGDKITVDVTTAYSVADNVLTVGTTQVTATANANYEFDGWYLGDAKVTAAGTIEVGGTYAFTAKFKLIQKDVTFTAENGTLTNGDAITANVTTAYSVADNVLTVGTTQVTAAPINANYEFDGWYLGDAKVTAAGTIEVGGTYAFTAKFKLIEKTANFTAVANGTVTPGSATVYAGDEIEVAADGTLTIGTVTVTVAPASADYKFAAWKLNGADIAADAKITADGEYNFTAEFVAVDVTISVTAQNGTVDNGTVDVKATDKITVDGQTIKVNGSVAATAQPDTNYEFVKWTLNDADITGEITVAAGNTYNFKAIYKIIEKTANFTTDGNGDVAPITATANAGADITVADNVLTFGDITVTATAHDGYKFLGWYIGDTKVENGKVDANTTYDIVAKFELNTINVTIEAGANGKVDKNSATAVIGKEITVDGANLKIDGVVVATATADTNYAFEGWYLNDATDKFVSATVTAGETYTFTAKFAIVVKTVAIAADVNGKVDNATANVEAGKTITADGASLKVDGNSIATATPNAGYKFIGWYAGDDAFTSATVTTDGTYSYIAKFEKDTFEMTVPAGVSVKVNDNEAVAGGENVKVNVQIGDTVVITANDNAMVTGVSYNGTAIIASEGKYTVPADKITEAITITVDAIDYFFITADQYKALANDSYKILAIKATANDKDYTYGDYDFYYSSKYEAYVAIIGANLKASDIGKSITSAAGSEEALKYDGDVNRDGITSAADAAIVSEILHAYKNGTTNYTDIMRLEADVFGEYTEGGAYVTASDCTWMLYKSVGLNYTENAGE